jgi:hypothetical protein
MYSIHMKRTNLVLDEQLLELAMRLSGERTYSGVVMRALDDFVRRIKAGRILDLAGTGLWEGELSQMRKDRPTPRKGSKRASR